MRPLSRRMRLLRSLLVAKMSVIGDDVVFRKRVSGFVRFDEAREGPECVVAETPLIAARIDESCVIEMSHAELLW